MVGPEDVFALVCGRVHCWTLGSTPLPFCQRCTGLYVGAACAVVLYAVFRPRPTPLVLWSHALMLLLMVPFGYHLVPHGGALRTLTGQLFAAGLVGYLGLLPLWRQGADASASPRTPWGYFAGLLISLVILQAAVHAGGELVAAVLAWLALAGLIALVALSIVNLVLLPLAIWRCVRPARPLTRP